MSKKKIIIVLVGILITMEGVAWMVFQKTETDLPEISEAVTPSPSREPSLPEREVAPPEEQLAASQGTFPLPTVEVVNGRAERTIHMGVRQYAWEPAMLTVKKGELVRLIVHNADVMHGLVIPELGVMNVDIPPDGAVIEFVADKLGTFEFFCSYYCGEGHMEMQGKIVVE